MAGSLDTFDAAAAERYRAALGALLNVTAARISLFLRFGVRDEG